MSDRAVILMAYGSPDRLEDVPAYYEDIRGGRPVRQELVDELVGRYRRLGIGDSPTSPLNRETERTRAALEQELALPVYTGMKHWHPRIPEAVEDALAQGATTLVGLVLAPHYSRLSIGDYRRRLDEALEDRARMAFVDSWHDDPGLIAFLADRVRGTKAQVVFTAHSLPARILDEGDPYERELLTTARLVADVAQLDRWSFSYQSESATGEAWLGPDILDHLTALHDQRVDDVLVCPIGFVADHLEIRWDIDVEAAEKARELGMHLARIEMPNADPAFVAVLARLVAQALARQPAPA
jgi:protoporphyrin/coproporphyrin ferrochelatase